MTTWQEAALAALDLEGSGAQDHDGEAILEIAIVPIIGGQPCPADSYTTLINPGRPIPRRPWISPGLTTAALSSAPPLSQVSPELAARLAGKVIVGHNVSVDWRLLHRCCPDIAPAGLSDTLGLARHLHPSVKGRGLTELLDRYGLTSKVSELVPGGQPHRALWDTTGTALLLTALISGLPEGSTLSLEDLQRLASGPSLNGGHPPAEATGQLTLLER
jgi:DNA polymerase III subunit epsilon